MPSDNLVIEIASPFEPDEIFLVSFELLSFTTAFALYLGSIEIFQNKYLNFLHKSFFMASTAELKNIATQIRRDIVRMVHAVNSGHPGGSLGCTDFLTALYFKVMKHNPSFDMNATEEDVFVLSNGHISPVFYSTLARSGYFDKKEFL